MLNVAPCHDPEYALREVTRDASEYYLREGEAPGRWWGAGAAALGLDGEVDAAALRDLFAGKHPDTGAYLISARGSSARANARHEEADLDTVAVAGMLGQSVEGVRARLRAGTLAGEKTPQGHWRIPSAAVDACLHGRPQPPSRHGLASPAPDGTYGLAEAARLAGVNVSYLKRLVRPVAPERTVRDDGRAVQYLVGRRDERDRWRVAASELERFMGARTRPGAVPAYDLVMRAPKSVSILHALGHLVPAGELRAMGLSPSVAAEVDAAHQAAVTDALELLERHAAWVRAPGERLAAEGLVVARFDHRSSRTGDPLLHTHAVIANVAQGPDGRRAALDGTALYAWASTAGHVYQARLRAELGTRLGVVFEQPHHGVADVAGMPRALIEHFSERRRQILDLMARLGTAGPEAARAATLSTRPPKDERSHRTPDELAAAAAALGFGGRELAGLLGQDARTPPPPERLGELAARLAGPEGLCERATLVDLRDAIKAFATELAQGARREDLERWATTLLHDGGRFVPVLARPTRGADVIRRADGRRVRAAGVAQAYSTPELLAHEAALVAAHASGLGPDGAGLGLGLAPPDALEQALAARPSLSGEQVEMVRRITTSGVGVEVVVGGPGAGKTFALGAAAQAWRGAGLRVVGAALQGGAAEVLAREAALDEEHTLAGLLGRCDHHGAAYLADAVVVVDEAGMADTRALSRLARYTAAAPAKLVLVGDPDQIPEVGAGGAFGHLVSRLGDAAVVLCQNRRQHDPAERQRLELIRQGKADAAIATARADGRWHTAPTGDGLRLALLRDWAADLGTPGTDKLMIATTVAEVEWLNRGARQLLSAAGRLGPGSITVELAAPDRAVDRRELRVGDVVRATRNDWDLGVYTGSVGTVVDLDADRRQLTVALDAGRGPARRVTLGPDYLQERETTTPEGRRQVQAPGLTHAYASTAHGVQGRTARRAYVLVTPAGMHRQAAYVAASRAAERTRYYGLAVPDPADVDRLDAARPAPEPDPADVRVLAQAMARDGSQTLASAAEPAAAQVGALMARPPAWLWAEHAAVAARVGLRPPLAESRRQVRAVLASTYGIEPAALECPPLEAAMNLALQVPGATAEVLAALMTRRHRAEVRELASAEDPVAVLVWAAQEAAEVLARRAPQAGEDQTRLAVLDVAIARQRAGRLAMVEAEPAGAFVALLGPPPAQGSGLGAWRRAAAAVLDYRDASGLFDRHLAGGDPCALLLAVRPADPAAAAHYDQVLATVVGARAAAVLAELARHVPLAATRPPPPVEALARRSLGELDGELGALGRQRGEAARRASAARAATRELGRAEEALAELASERTGPGGRRRRVAEAALAERRAAAQTRAVAARHRVAATAALVVAAEPERAALVSQAVAVRKARLRARTLTDPPAWLRDDVARRVEHRPLRPAEVERLARAYGDVALYADRWGADTSAAALAEVPGRVPPSPAAARVWAQLTADLQPPKIAQARGVDLSR